MQSFPGPSEHDIEAVQDALEVARTQWHRGERQEALRWLRRAIDAAFDQGDDRRGLTLSKAASELQAMVHPAPPLPTQRLVAASSAPSAPSVPTVSAPAATVTPSSAPPALPSRRPPAPARPRMASMAPPELPSRPAPTTRPGLPPAARIPMPTPTSGAPQALSAPARPLRGPVPAVGPGPNPRSTRRNSRVHPGEAGRPTARAGRVESAAGGAPSVMRAETDLPTLQGERSPLADGDTSVIPMPDVAALAAAHAARAVGERTAPYAPAVVPVLTQSVRVAVGPGPTLRLLPASEGLRPGEFEAWLTATSPAVDLAASLRTKRS